MSRTPIIEKNQDKVIIPFHDDSNRTLEIIELIAEGGSGLIYRAVENDHDSKSACIIKEYYPEEINIAYKGVEYKRMTPGKPLTIVSDSDEQRLKQIRLQNSWGNRECAINQLLFHGDSDPSNSPYFFQMQPLNNIAVTEGDTIYFKVATSEGQTLKQEWEEFNGNSHNEYERFLHAIDITEKILDIIDRLMDKNYVHCDMAMDNLFITGEGKNRQVKLLDFGSAFSVDEFTVKNKFNREEIIRTADRINFNITVGSSHKYIRSPRLHEMMKAREAYRIAPGYENAKRLVDSINAVDFSTDIYACAKLFYKMIAGEEYDPQVTREGMAFALHHSDVPDSLSDTVFSLMRRNNDMAFSDTDAFRKELQEIRNILEGKFTPASLIQALQNSLSEIEVPQCDPLLIPSADKKLEPIRGFGRIVSGQEDN